MTSQNVEEKLNGLMKIMAALCRVLQKENTLMKEQRQSEVASLLEEKTKAAAAYEQSFMFFKKHDDILKSLPEKQKKVIRSAAMTLKRLTQENGTLLKTNIEASKILLNAIVDDIKEQNKEKHLYTADGAVGVKNGTPTAISYNKVL